MDVAGHVNKLKDESVTIDPKADIQQFHIRNIGKLIEANESEIRSEMYGITLNKSKQIINTGRLKQEYMTKNEKSSFQQELMEMMKKNQ